MKNLGQRGLKPSLSILLLFMLLVGAFQLSRPGYSVDEEFTIFAVRGISATGLPILPSGLLYDRGLAYSYASWLASLLPGDDLVAARALSLISVALTLVLIFMFFNRQFASDRLALLATAAAASSISFWAAATTARFYGPFLLTYVAALLCMQRRSWIALLVVAMFSRWTHELAFTLLAIPLVGILLCEREQRGRWVRTGLAIGLGLLIAQLVILALHYTVPSSGDTMIRRFFVWQVLNLFQRPPDRQFAIPLVVMVIAWLIAPKRAFPIAVIALCISGFIIGMSRGQFTAGSRYPLDMFWSLAKAAPFLTIVTFAALAGRVAGLGGEWPLVERGFHFMWIGWVIWFGIIESGITLNYQLLPITMMILAVAVDLFAIARARGVPFVSVTLVLIVLCGNQWGARWVGETLAAERPTIQIEGIESLRDSIQPGDRIACTDELACLLLVGRDDAWLALDDFVRERFVVARKDSSVGVYGGAPAVFRPSDLFGDLGAKNTPERVLIVDVFKEYPVGNSRTWLPRALAQDGIEGKILLETPQARVVQISAPERNALQRF